MNSTAPLTREALERLPRQPLRQPSPLKPAVWRVETPMGAVVVKDVRPCGRLQRGIARWLLERERRVLERVGTLDGVPHLLGRIDRDAVVLSLVPGRPLDAALFGQRPRDLVAQLRELTEELHERGVFHLDLHQRKNLLVDDSGRLHVVDFGAAFALGPLARLLFGWLLGHVDRQAAYKYLARFTPEELTVDEARAVLRHRSLRRMWPFTPHGAAEGRAARRRLER